MSRLRGEAARRASRDSNQSRDAFVFGAVVAVSQATILAHPLPVHTRQRCDELRMWTSNHATVAEAATIEPDNIRITPNDLKQSV